jgi:phage N-6-adenine-methyltransferase
VSQSGIKPKNHPQQVRTRQSELFHESGGLDAVDDRRTPRTLFDPLHAEFSFTIDAAASADNALLRRYWSREESALVRAWDNERVWCNPPYSSLPDWVAKADDSTRSGACPLVVVLLPADRTEQPWWQDRIEPYRDRDIGLYTRFIRKRVKFGLPPEHPGAGKGLAKEIFAGVTRKKNGGYRYPPFGCVLVIFDGLARWRDKR